MSLAAADLRKTLGRRRSLILKDLSITCTSRRIAILGPNGAGKTTLFSILATLTRPDSGSISVEPFDLSSGEPLEAYRNGLGIVPQDFRAMPSYTCSEFLEYVAWLKRVEVRAVEGRIRDVLDRVNLADNARTPVKALSGGMRQRLGLAQAMIGEPTVLLMDEPTAGLDPVERDRFAASMRNLAGDPVVVFTTHLSSDVVAVAHEVVVLQEGRALFCGLLGDLVEQGAGSREVAADSVDKAYISIIAGSFEGRSQS